MLCYEIEPGVYLPVTVVRADHRLLIELDLEQQREQLLAALPEDLRKQVVVLPASAKVKQAPSDPSVPTMPESATPRGTTLDELAAQRATPADPTDSPAEAPKTTVPRPATTRPAPTLPLPPRPGP